MSTISINPPPSLHRWKHNYSILCSIPFPSKKILFAGTQDSKILCFDSTTYTLIKTIKLGYQQQQQQEGESNLNDAYTDKLENTKSSVLCLAKSQDEHYLFAGGADSLVRIWNIDVEPLKTTSANNFNPGNIIIQEIAAIYSTIDIGDIFSLTYLDSTQTVIFGSQRASLLYVSDIFNSKICSHSYDKLPHVRYDKFFDSTGPDGKKPVSVSSPISRGISPCLANSNDTLYDGINNQSSVIIEVPSENIILYAHNGFIYSLCQYENNLEHNKKYICSGAGDGISKIWTFNKKTLKLEYIFQLPYHANTNAVKQDAFEIDGDTGEDDEDEDEDEDDDDIVYCQAVQFPFLYCGLNSGIVKIYDLNTRQLVSVLTCGTTDDVTGIVVYKDCVFVATKNSIFKFTGNSDRYKWDINGQLGNILSMSLFSCEQICKNCSRLRLVTGSNDGSLVLWNITDLVDKKLNEYQEYPHTLKCIDFNNDHLLQTLKELVGFQSVSSSSNINKYLIDSHRCATYLVDLLNQFGASSKLIPVLKGNKNPIVYGKFKANTTNSGKKKSILWYGHYDVIPAEDTTSWVTDPFKLTSENGFLKARGVSDNKGPLLAAIYAIADVYNNNQLQNDITFLIEGQEESGSRGFFEALNNNLGKEESFDWILFSNSYWLDQHIPCLNYGLRGVINSKITITSKESDRHSGVDGGVHKEPTTEIFQIISKLIESNDKVLIPEFYSTLKPISESELKNFKKILERTNIDHTIDDLIVKWTRPSLSITSMSVSGPGNVTVIPKSATVSVSIRIVPEQNLNDVKTKFITYLENNFKKLMSKNQLFIEILNEAEPWLGNPDNRAYQIIRKEVEDVWGTEPLLVREGGSIPMVRVLEQHFNAPAIQIPCGQSTDNAHLDNEQLRIVNFFNLRVIIHNVINRL
ncbi:related to Probable di- and tripeptidase DUG2 [Saccharomycodes ludwigii]|uniref:Related to Probable di- and tripeptidase DUG2 n=1 Tax=Saccharomycodes ludwigii TaxID=36035 RepID=A0A376B3A5_9ASCO|nr:related to Probable di- and tripeptidase DUG2 [Saccharomycodes ludwigii]